MTPDPVPGETGFKSEFEIPNKHHDNTCNDQGYPKYFHELNIIRGA